MQYTAPLGPFFSTECMDVRKNRTVMAFDAQSLVRPTPKASPLGQRRTAQGLVKKPV